MTDGNRRLTSAEARRLWERAAELQAQSAGRAEQFGGAPAESAVPADGYSLALVRDAAADAGISREFVDRALAEGAGVAPSGSGSLAAWLVGSRQETILATRRFAQPVPLVRDAVLAAFPRNRLTLIDRRIATGAAGESLAFALPGGAGGASALGDWSGGGDVREIRLVLEPDGTGGTLATLGASVVGDRDRHRLTGLAATVGGVVFGGWGLGALGAVVTVQAGLAGLLGGAVIGGALAIGFGLGGALGLRFNRRAFRAALASATRGLERLLHIVGVELDSPASVPGADRGLPSG